MNPNATKDEREKRKWRTSLFASFSSNLLFLLYGCDGNSNFKVSPPHSAVSVPSHVSMIR